MKKLKRGIKGITLVALVVTIIVLLILSGIAISLIVGNKGLFNRAEMASNEYNKQEATEKVNLKITSTQIRVYAESERMPTLQEVADDFCEDNEVQYVALEKQKTANIDKIIVGKAKSIFTKLKNYPYEFEIDDSLRLASINGIKLAENDNGNTDLLSRIESLESEVKTLKQDNELLKADNTQLKNKVNVLENETILNKRVKLTPENFTPITLSFSTSQPKKSIILTDSIKNYKYLEFQVEGKNTGGYWGSKSIFISTERMKISNTDAITWQEDSNFILNINYGQTHAIGAECYFKNEKEIVIDSGVSSNTMAGDLIIKEVHGLK